MQNMSQEVRVMHKSQEVRGHAQHGTRDKGHASTPALFQQIMEQLLRDPNILIAGNSIWLPWNGYWKYSSNMGYRQV